MHSSRMRTGRSLTVCCSVLPGGVLLGPGGGVFLGLGGSPWFGGGSPWSGGGGSPWSGGVSGEPPPLTESQTRVKT